MKANELICGNKVIYNDKIIDIFNIDETNVNQEYVHEEKWNAISLSDIYPIPLTEEWLLKFGFEKHTAELCKAQELFYTHKGFDSGVYFVINAKEIIKGDFDECVFIKLPKFVHKLQNLYFALTDNELEIK